MSKHVFDCIDAHTCGNPVRVVRAGGPELEGTTMMEKRLHFMREFDWIRTGLMFEPRGHDLMSGSILYSPADEENDVGVIFIETSGCLPMCGHGIIGTVTIIIEHELIIPKVSGKLRLETPAGLVKVDYEMHGDKVHEVKLTNVPSFLHSRDLEIISDSLGSLSIDVAYGGNFYAIVDRQDHFAGIDEYAASELIGFSRQLRDQINGRYSFEHPEDDNIHGCSHILWEGKTRSNDATARNAVFYGDNAIDRSPCGTGTCARMAQWVARGKMKKGDTFIHESIIGSTFVGKVEELTQVGPFDAIIPSVKGWARITGINQIVIDPEDDPYAYGFQVI